MTITHNGSALSEDKKAELMSGFGIAQPGRFSMAIRALKAGRRTRPVIALGMGDSNMTAQGAGTGTNGLVGARALGPWVQVKTYAPSIAGLAVSTNSIIGDGNQTDVPINSWDPRINLGATTPWTTAVRESIAGRFFDGAVGSDDLTLTFDAGTNRVELYFPQYTTGYSASVGVYASDGTQVGTFSNTAGANAVTAAQFTSTKFADGIVRIRNLSGASPARVFGGIGWDFAAPGIILATISSSNARWSYASGTANPWSGSGILNAIKPDLVYSALSINDIANGTALATLNSEMSSSASIITRYAEWICGTGAPPSVVGMTNGVSQGIEVEMIKVASSYGADYLSMHRYFGDVSGGADWFDWGHQRASGYAKQAEVLAKVLQFRAAGSF